MYISKNVNILSFVNKLSWFGFPFNEVFTSLRKINIVIIKKHKNTFDVSLFNTPNASPDVLLKFCWLINRRNFRPVVQHSKMM